MTREGQVYDELTMIIDVNHVEVMLHVWDQPTAWTREKTFRVLRLKLGLANFHDWRRHFCSYKGDSLQDDPCSKKSGTKDVWDREVLLASEKNTQIFESKLL